MRDMSCGGRAKEPSLACSFCVDGGNVAHAAMIAMRAMKLDFVDRVVPRMRRAAFHASKQAGSPRSIYDHYDYFNYYYYYYYYY